MDYYIICGISLAFTFIGILKEIKKKKNETVQL